MSDPKALPFINEYAVPYKVKAADYHLKRMRRILEVGLVVGEAMDRLEGEARAIAHERHDRFFWEFESFLFQLYSAFDLVLQELSLRRGLGIRPHKVTWQKIVKRLTDNPVVTHLNSVRNEDWFVRLQGCRHEITHRRPPVFVYIHKTGEVEAACFGWPVMGGVGGPEVFGVCDRWWANARDALREALRLMREADL